MVFQKWISVAVTAFIVFHLGLSAPHAADRHRSIDSGQPRELINHPICSSLEQPDETVHCEYAQRL